MPQAGKLRDAFILEEPIYANDLDGTRELFWRFVKRVTLEVKPVRASEAFDDHRVTHTVTHRATGRYDRELKPERRLVRQQSDSQEVYAIAGVMDPDGRRRDIEMTLVFETNSPAVAG